MSEKIPTPIIIPPRKAKQKTKRQQHVAALASCMRLLVVIREALRANKEEKNPLFEAVNEHARLCGSLIPDHMRMPIEEFSKVQENSQVPEQSRIIKP